MDNNKSKQIDLVNKINNIIMAGTKNDKFEEDANLIINNLWLGNYMAAHNLEFITAKKIGHIINVTDDIPNKFLFIDYTKYPVKDLEACQKNLFKIIENGANIIHNSLLSNKAVLVHCKRGHHRSASIVAFYLVKYCKVSLIDAVRFIKNIRPSAFRRMNCMLKTLVIYTEELSPYKSIG